MEINSPVTNKQIAAIKRRTVPDPRKVATIEHVPTVYRIYVLRNDLTHCPHASQW